MAQFTRSHLVNCGGVNNSVSDELIADNELADARNLVPDYTGAAGLIKRAGLTANSATTAYGGDITGWYNISAFRGRNGLYFTDATTTAAPAYAFNIHDLAYDAEGDATASSLYDDSSAGAYEGSWASIAGYDIFSDSTRAVKTSDGAAFTPVANFPSGGQIVCEYNNYLFATVRGTSSLRWSGEEDPETWDAAHELVFTGDYTYPVSVRSWAGELVVFTLRGLLFVQGFGATDFTVSHRIEHIGAYNHRLTCATPLGIFWWSYYSGLCWSRDGQTIDFPMMRKLQGTWTACSKTSGFMYWRPDRLCLSVIIFKNSNPWSDDGTLRVDYYPLRDAFFISNHSLGSTSGIIAGVVDDASFDTYQTSPIYYTLYRDHAATTGKVYAARESETVSTDIGASVTAYLKTKRFWGTGNPTVEAILNDVVQTTNLATGGAITYGYYLDNATSLTRSVDSTVGTGVQDKRIGINARYRKIQHYLSDSLSERTRYIALHELGDAAGRVTK